MPFPTRRSAPAPLEWWHRYVDIPHRDHGRDERGVDCWGLVLMVLRQEREQDIPEPPALYASTRLDDPSVADFARSSLPSWREGPLEPFSVLLFTVAGNPVHVGIAIDDRRFLHSQAPIGVHALDLDRGELGGRGWRERLLGAYTYVG